jgi:CDP-diacylglycerol---glycerol-3-phosphate 3-phosphatidyltransferase
VIFAVASMTDRIDGDLARRRGLVTEFGKLADPIADKALTGTALVSLSSLGLLPWWVTVLILVREIGVTLLRFWVIRHGVLPASRGGKLKTLVQGVAIGLYVLPLSGVLAWVAAVSMGIAVVLTVGTGIDYVTRALTLRRTSARALRKRQQVGRSTGAQDRPTRPDRRPTLDHRPTGPDRPTPDHRYGGADHQYAGADHRPAGRDHRPGTRDDRPTGPVTRAAAPHDRPPTRDDRPVRRDDRPAAPDDRPVPRP